MPIRFGVRKRHIAHGDRGFSETATSDGEILGPSVPAPLTSNRRELLLTTATAFVLVLGMSLVAPVLPQYTIQLGVSTAAAGFAVGAFAIGELITSSFGAVIARAIGYRVTAFTSGVVTGATALLAATDVDYPVLVVLRLAQGAGTGMFIGAALARLLEVTPSTETGRMLSRYVGSLMIGASLGPVAGGWIAEVWGLRAPFLVWGGITLVASALSAWSMPRQLHSVPPAPRQVGVPRRAVLVALFHRRSFRTAMVVTLVIFWARQGFRHTAVPIIAADEFEMSPGVIGTVMMAASLLNAAAMPHAGRVLDRSGRRQLLVRGSAATALSVLAIAAVSDKWTLTVATVALAVASGYPSIGSAGAVSVLGAAERPAALGVQRFLSQAGQALGPLTIGVLLDVLGFRGAAIAAAVVVAVTALHARTIDCAEATSEPEPHGQAQVIAADGLGSV